MPHQKALRVGILAFLLLGLVFTSSSAFAYWQEVTVSNDVEVVTIGEPVQLVVTDLNSTKQPIRLVPRGQVMDQGDVNQVMLTYRVGISKELLNSVNLIVTVTNATIGGDDTYSQLIDIDILGSEKQAVLELFNEELIIPITLRLLEPIDQEEANARGLNQRLVNVTDAKLAYESIKGKTISFNIQFELKKKQTLN